ncbi:MAG: hypothetical protein A2460_02325 [Omnitrophica WOR_2 bacterium RIFOXYC2_FULL_43_9]|nr:MAG: hypothetical protein A2460_02325 [Omnitrophica WOR_2 bacterium RIFOXYC2_FULL_43_9]
MGFVYILKNQKGGFYIGSTADLNRRVKQHLAENTFTTKRMKAFELVFSQEYRTLMEAKKIELKLKKLKRKDYIAKIVQDGFIKIKP